jgi:hypothetical protein
MNIKECRKETQKHIDNVKNILNKWSKEIVQRGKLHDKSKLESPEVEIFCEYTPKLANSTYGSEKYKGFLKEMQVALNHHYRMNKHHPEHFRNGIQDMNLIDIMELLADWKSATLRHNDGDLIRSINLNQERFGYDNDLKQILLNTAELLYAYKIFFGCCDGREGMYLSDTIEGIHKKIDEDKQLNNDEKNILKYGYEREFKDKDFYNYNICINNGFDCYWYKQSYFK